MADLDRIREKCSEDERRELDALAVAEAQTLAAYQEGYKKADLERWRAAAAELEGVRSKLAARYFTEERVFPHRKAAHAWLVDQGWKVSVGGFHNHVKAGKCVVEGDGTVRESALIAYAEQNLKRIEDEEGELTPLMQEKERVALKREQKKLDKETFEYDLLHKKYMPRRDFNLELSARAGVLDQGVQNFFRTRTSDWVSMVGGDVKKVSMVLDVILAEWNELLAEYADKEQFHVIFGEKG